MKCRGDYNNRTSRRNRDVGIDAVLDREPAFSYDVDGMCFERQLYWISIVELDAFLPVIDRGLNRWN
jgi:hypothetical protein